MTNREIALNLSGYGWTRREIADHLGISKSTVDNWIADPDGRKLRARHDKYRGVCDTCGWPTSGSGGRNRVPTRCQGCKTWTPEALIEWVCSVADDNGGIPPRVKDFPGGRAAARRHFGSWNGLLIAAGYELHRDRRPETTEAIFNALRNGESVKDIADRHGVGISAIYGRCKVRGLTSRKVRSNLPE